MKNIELTVWERLQLRNIVSVQQGNWEQGRRYLRLLRKLKFSEEEEKAIEMKVVENQDRTISFHWEEQGQKYEMEMEDADYELLYKLADGFGNWAVDERVDALRGKMMEVKEAK